MSGKAKAITSVDDLTPDARNANRHTQRGMAMMETSLRECGYGDSVTVDREGRVISGNGRVETLASIGMTDAIVVQSDGTRPIIHQRTDLDLITDERAKRLALLQNRTGQVNLEWDAQVLAELAEQGTELDDLFAPDELNALLGDLAKPVAGAGGDEFDTTPDDGPTRVQPGEVWRIGPHRIICGDCTDTATVARVMDGAKADLMLTDPPYGVSYVGKTSDALTLSNDDLDDPALADLWGRCCDAATEACRPGAYWFATVPAGPLHLIFAADWKRRGVLRQIMVWVKNSLVLGHSEYHYRHEPILFGWLPGPRRPSADRSKDTVWEYDRPTASRDHPTMKPIELWQRPIADSTGPGNVVYDPFLGSGTTLIAAHRLGRVAFGCEIEPRYCDVILRRAEAEGIGPIERIDG